MTARLPKSALRRVFDVAVSNVPYKILSVLIAVALWFIVRDQRVETSVTWQLDVQAPAELVVGNETVPDLVVGVAGTRVALDRLKQQTLIHTVKLKTDEPGIVALHLRPEDLAVPPGVEVVHLTPSTINLRLETRSTRRVPVRPRIVLEDPAYRVKKVTVVPERVRIEGPASVVAAVDQIFTEAIAIAPKAPDALSGTFGLSLPHPQLKVTDFPSVQVAVELEPVATASPSATPAPPATPAGRKSARVR